MPDGALQREMPHGDDRSGVTGRHRGQRLSHSSGCQLAKFPAADVTLYLDTLLCQDPETWGGLADVERKQA